jgi:hypothetical protein
MSIYEMANMCSTVYTHTTRNYSNLLRKSEDNLWLDANFQAGLLVQSVEGFLVLV